MKRNDVLWVGAAASILLFSGAWLTGYFENRIFAWIGIFTSIVVASGISWFSRDKNDNYQEIAKRAALFGAAIYLGASILGLVATRWTHGTWSPELTNTTEGVMSKIFSNFPGHYLRNIMHPTFSTVIFGSILISIWAALGSSFLPIPEQKNSKKGRK